MELKQTSFPFVCYERALLIVPYGIETPAGICSYTVSAMLLIVPYGIETNEGNMFRKHFLLLIVPYGIETPVISRIIERNKAFNRTLWN